jgi:hypothetical protein
MLVRTVKGDWGTRLIHRLDLVLGLCGSRGCGRGRWMRGCSVPSHKECPGGDTGNGSEQSQGNESV